MKVLNNVFIEVRDAKTKEVVDTREMHNLMTTNGLNWVRDLMGGTETRATKIALGRGETAPTASDTALDIQVWGIGNQGVIDRRIATAQKMTHKIFLGSEDANGNVLSEAGLFRGTLLLARTLISPPLTKSDAVELTIAHEITVS